MDWKDRLKEVLVEARRQSRRAPNKRRRGSGPAAERTKSKNADIRAYKTSQGIPLKEPGHSITRGPGSDAEPAGETMRNDVHYQRGETEAHQQAAIDGMRAAAARRQRQKS